MGRLLRGTDQAMLSAFWIAEPSPMAPYSAASEPMTMVVVEPVSPSGRRNWSPMIGNWLSAESSTCSDSSGFPWSTKPRIELASSSSGKTAKSA